MRIQFKYGHVKSEVNIVAGYYPTPPWKLVIPSWKAAIRIQEEYRQQVYGTALLWLFWFP